MKQPENDVSSNPEVIVACNEAAGIIVYICPKCLKSFGARQESEYYHNSAAKCCAVTAHIPTRTFHEGNVDGPCFGSSDTFYMDVEDAVDQGEVQVTSAVFTPYFLSVDRLDDIILDGHHDDASVEDLVGYGELCDAVDIFNAKQVHGSYFEGKTLMTIPYNKTFAMIKPCAVAAGHTAAIKRDIEAAGFRIVESCEAIMERSDAEQLYQEHSQKAHFRDLVDFTISGPAELLIIEGDGQNVPEDFRSFAIDSIRPRYTETVRRNGIHASDSPIAAHNELELFNLYFA